jgi:hypothetical protein
MRRLRIEGIFFLGDGRLLAIDRIAQPIEYPS